MTPPPISPAANTAGGAQYGPAMPAGGLSPSRSLPAQAAARQCCSAARARGTTSRPRPRARGPVRARVQFPAGTDDTTSDAREFLATPSFLGKLASRRWKNPPVGFPLRSVCDSRSFRCRQKGSSRGVADNFRSARSSAAQRLNRLEGGRASRWIPAEGDAKARGESDRGYNSRRLYENRPAEGSGDEPG
jgi:hypothetical protein